MLVALAGLTDHEKAIPGGYAAARATGLLIHGAGIPWTSPCRWSSKSAADGRLLDWEGPQQRPEPDSVLDAEAR